MEEEWSCSERQNFYLSKYISPRAPRPGRVLGNHHNLLISPILRLWVRADCLRVAQRIREDTTLRFRKLEVGSWKLDLANFVPGAFYRTQCRGVAVEDLSES